METVCTNHVPNCKLSSDDALSKKQIDHGYSEEYVVSAYDIKISSFLWKDTNSLLLSTYVGTKPFASQNSEKQPEKAVRYDRKVKEHYEINCPKIIKEYNHH